MKERLNKVLEEYGLNSSRLAEKMGIQRSGISHIMAGRNKPSYDFIVGLLKIFPELDANWLLTGEGSMFKENNDDKEKENSNSSPVNQPDLFSSISQDIPNRAEKTGKHDLSDKEEKSGRADSDPGVYKNKQIENDDNGVESVLILLNNGKFKSYKPE